MAPDDVQPEVEPPVTRTWAIPVFTAKPADASLLAIGRRVGDLLARPDALPFSASAMEELKARFESHVIELVSESGRIARRQQADVISSAYVRQAGDRLVVRQGAASISARRLDRRRSGWGRLALPAGRRRGE